MSQQDHPASRTPHSTGPPVKCRRGRPRKYEFQVDADKPAPDEPSTMRSQVEKPQPELNKGKALATVDSTGPPVKRRRGRPRKYEFLVDADKPAPNEPSTMRSQVEKPQPELSKGKALATEEEVNTDGSAEDDQLTGQVVTGVLESKFAGGYFLSMRVEESGRQLRGIVFELDKHLPVTEGKDIVPLAKMSSRPDFPVLVAKSQAQVHVEKDIVGLEANKQHVALRDLEKQGLDLQAEKQSGQIMIDKDAFFLEVEKQSVALKTQLEQINVERSSKVPIGSERCVLNKGPIDDFEENDEEDVSLEPLAKKLETDEATHSREAVSAAPKEQLTSKEPDKEARR